MSSEPPIICFKDVYKYYHAGNEKVTALSGVSLEIQQGDFVSIMGPSGGGKTTFLNCLGGLDLPDRGEIFLKNRLMNNMNDKELTELRRKEIGFIFQFFNLMPTLTILENVELPLLINHSARNQSKQVQTLLDYVGLAHRPKSFPAELSGGEMQRVAIARALVHRPAIVLADEPTGNLDSDNGIKILELMKKASVDFDTTVVMATHNIQIADYGNRHFEIRDGKATIRQS
jgi:putative ABC transport system ATP-binding protein